MILDKDGYPVESVIGRPVLNFIRYCIHGRMYISTDMWNTICKNQRERTVDGYKDMEPKIEAQK
jgi:hypothetical protein